MRRAVALLFIAVAGCDHDKVAATRGAFDPVRFFSGHSEGDATLRTIAGSSHHVSVDSRGKPDGHDGLVLDQTISEEGKAPRTRRWTLHPAGPDRWSGQLTDAEGGVTVERTPGDVTIRYRMKNGASVEQHLQQQTRNSVENHMTVSRFGIRLAVLDEEIRKVGG